MPERQMFPGSVELSVAATGEHPAIVVGYVDGAPPWSGVVDRSGVEGSVLLDRLGVDRSSPLSALAVVLGLAAVAGLVVLVLTVGSEPSESADGREATTPATIGSEPLGDSAGQPAIGGPGVGVGASSPAGAGSSASGAGGSNAGAAGLDAWTTESVVMFRALIAERDILADELSDAEIATFGSMFCVMAAGSHDVRDFRAVGVLAISESDSELDDASLWSVISTGVEAFCPLEGERLGFLS